MLQTKAFSEEPRISNLISRYLWWGLRSLKPTCLSSYFCFNLKHIFSLCQLAYLTCKTDILQFCSIRNRTKQARTQQNKWMQGVERLHFLSPLVSRTKWCYSFVPWNPGIYRFITDLSWAAVSGGWMNGDRAYWTLSPCHHGSDL